jgi:hypothetical protein
MPPEAMRRLARAGALTAVVDGCFATALAVLAHGSSAARLWQGVAATVLGPSALGGGAGPLLVGLLLHVGVALGWSAVFLALHAASPALRRLASTPGGVLAVAAVYGPLIWCVMSLLVVPALTGRPPSVTPRWWVQLLGHVPFVAVPIVASIGLRRPPERTDGPATA